MRVRGRLFFIIIISCSAYSCGSTEHFGRHLLSLFGFRISERSAVPIRHFVYSPVIIIPTLKQKNNVNIQESDAAESYQENGDVFQRLTTKKDEINTVDSVNQISFNISKQNDYKDDNNIDPRETIDARSSNDTTEDTPTIATEETTTLEAITFDQIKESQTEKTKFPEGSYPTPKYDNEFIKNLSLTTSTPLKSVKFALPEDNDNWTMFASSTKENIELYQTLPHPNENRWSRLSSYEFPMSGQFVPIAGLYHDGYLHRPLLNKQGFVPSRQLF